MEVFRPLLDAMLSIWYFWVLVLLAAIFKLFKPKITGFFGEKTVNMLLSRLPKEKYHILNDVLLKTKTGTTQIDHVVVSAYGVFVIETKTYKGWIQGGEHDEYWAQNLYGKKYRFKNPIRQNYGHVKALEELLLAYSGVPVIPIVAFSGECTLKVKTKENKVVYFSGIKKAITQYTAEAADPRAVSDIAQLIRSSGIEGHDARKAHVASVKAVKQDAEDKIAGNICPKCGGSLITRQGRYGEFVGCANFPKCRFALRK